MPEERRFTMPMLLLFSLPCLGCIGSMLSATLALAGGAVWLGLAVVPGVFVIRWMWRDGRAKACAAT